MLDNHMLAAPGEQLTLLDDEALASVVGGGPLAKILGEIGRILWDCVKDGLDDVISAAEEGYADSQSS